MSICSQDIEQKRSFGVNKGAKFGKMMHNNPKLDLVNMNAYLKLGEMMSFYFQDIEQKLNFGVNQGP